MELLKRVEELVSETEKEVRELHSCSVSSVPAHSQELNDLGDNFHSIEFSSEEISHTHQLDWHWSRIHSLNQLSKDIQALTQAIYVTSGCNIKEDKINVAKQYIKTVPEEVIVTLEDGEEFKLTGITDISIDDNRVMVITNVFYKEAYTKKKLKKIKLTSDLLDTNQIKVDTIEEVFHFNKMFNNISIKSNVSDGCKNCIVFTYNK